MKLLDVLRDELIVNFDGRALAGRILSSPLPIGIGTRTRARILRACGIDIAEGVTIAGPITITGGRRASSNVHVGRRCFINVGCVMDASAPIEIGNDVAVGQHVLFTTNSHVWDDPARRAGTLVAAPIRVGDGAWIAARAVLLPGVTVGDGAIVMAGAVVTRSIPPHTMAGGVPARPIREMVPQPPALRSPG